MTSVPLPTELEKRVRHIAESRGEDVNDYVSRAILRQEADESTPDNDLDRAIEEAALDPLFMADIVETMRAFRHVDSETSRIVPNE